MSEELSWSHLSLDWIDTDHLVRRSAALALRRFKGEHNYEKIATMLSDIHAEFELSSSKITHVVTDNGSNFVKAFREFGKKDNVTEDTNSTEEEDENEQQSQNNRESSSEDSDSDNTNENIVLESINVGEILTRGVDEINEADNDFIYLPKHLPCAAHTLNLLASKDATAAIENAAYKAIYRSVIAKCSSLSNSVHRSCKNAECAQEVLGRTIPKANSTRWNSEFDTLNTINSVKDKVNQLMEQLKLPKFKETEFEFLSEWLQAMHPVAIAPDMLQGETSMEAYFGAILPTILNLSKKLEAMDGTTKYCDPLINALRKGIETRFSNLTSFDVAKRLGKNYIIAAVAHPFFRLRWLPNNDCKETAQELFLQELYASGKRLQLSSKKLETDSASRSNAIIHKELSISPNSNAPKVQLQHKIHSFYGFESVEISEERDKRVVIREEGISYLENENFTEDLSILKKYPYVQKLFIETNTATPSSAPVERLFSCAGQVFLPRRNRLSDIQFEQLLLLKKNSFFSC